MLDADAPIQRRVDPLFAVLFVRCAAIIVICASRACDHELLIHHTCVRTFPSWNARIDVRWPRFVRERRHKGFSYGRSISRQLSYRRGFKDVTAVPPAPGPPSPFLAIRSSLSVFIPPEVEDISSRLRAVAEGSRESRLPLDMTVTGGVLETPRKIRISAMEFAVPQSWENARANDSYIGKEFFMLENRVYRCGLDGLALSGS